MSVDAFRNFSGLGQIGSAGTGAAGMVEKLAGQSGVLGGGGFGDFAKRAIGSRGGMASFAAMDPNQPMSPTLAAVRGRMGGIPLQRAGQEVLNGALNAAVGFATGGPAGLVRSLEGSVAHAVAGAVSHIPVVGSVLGEVARIAEPFAQAVSPFVGLAANFLPPAALAQGALGTVHQLAKGHEEPLASPF